MSTEDVVKRLRTAKFGPVRKHAVKVQGTLYPVKEAFAAVSGLDVLDFNTNQARSWFRNLGFEVVRVPTPSRGQRV